MKRLICLLILTLLTTGWAQSPTPSPEIEESQDPAQVEFDLLQQHMIDAINAHDIDSFLEGVTENVVVTTPSGRILRGRELVRGFLEKSLKGPDPPLQSVKSKLQLEELLVLYSKRAENSGEPYGVAYGHSQDTFSWADGTTMNLQARWSAALVRDEQSWKVAEFHYSVDMFDNPVLSKAKQGRLLYCFGGLLVGILLGYLI